MLSLISRGGSYIPADKPPGGGQDAIRRVLLNDGVKPRRSCASSRRRTPAGKKPTAHDGLHASPVGPNGQVFVLNKHDGTIRLLVPRM